MKIEFYSLNFFFSSILLRKKKQTDKLSQNDATNQSIFAVCAAGTAGIGAVAMSLAAGFFRVALVLLVCI